MSPSHALLTGYDAGSVTIPPLHLAVAAYRARYRGASRQHVESDLRVFLTWCADHGLDPLAAQRPHIELYLRWMQEDRQFRPSTVSRRASIVCGFYRTCVIDEVLAHSRPSMCVVPMCRPSRRRWGRPICSWRRC